MDTALLTFASLPHQNATQAKNEWGRMRRLVQTSGAVVITSHNNPDMVLVDAKKFEELTKGFRAVEASKQNVLLELTRQFDARLKILKSPEFAGKVDQVLSSKGKLKSRPKVGESF